jgi:hypothetical protein
LAACFVVIDSNQKLAYIYFEDEPVAVIDVVRVDQKRSIILVRRPAILQGAILQGAILQGEPRRQAFFASLAPVLEPRDIGEAPANWAGINAGASCVWPANQSGPTKP